MDVKLKAKLTESAQLNAGLRNDPNLNAHFGNTQIVHTDNYNDLYNKPSINKVTVQGDKLGADYRLQDKMDIITEQMIDNLFYGRA